MEISFLIVTRQRTEDLRFTLSKLNSFIDKSKHEVLVFIDGCNDTMKLKVDYDWVKWYHSEINIGASPARERLYKNATGNIFVGLDDDAHLLNDNFVSLIKNEFNDDKSLGVVAFQEIRGVFNSDIDCLKNKKKSDVYYTSDFVGCGFAILKEAYLTTSGFPTFLNIYGEESCVALEILNNGYQIKYQPEICINHRVDMEKRKRQGRNYFRFEKQLRNTFRYYIVYYPNPVKSILKLYLHNFKKYALKDKTYFMAFFKAFFGELIILPKTLKYRKPVSKNVLKQKAKLQGLSY